MLLNNPREFLIVCLIGLLFWFVVGAAIVYADPLFGSTITDSRCDDGKYDWHKNHEPAHSVYFVKDPTLKWCPPDTIACAVWKGDACIVYTPMDWTEEDWCIMSHELKHCAGMDHQK